MLQKRSGLRLILIDVRWDGDAGGDVAGDMKGSSEVGEK
jgi:hypothetical protein